MAVTIEPGKIICRSNMKGIASLAKGKALVLSAKPSRNSQENLLLVFFLLLVFS